MEVQLRVLLMPRRCVCDVQVLLSSRIAELGVVVDRVLVGVVDVHGKILHGAGGVGFGLDLC